MPVLVIGDEERTKIAAAIAYAKAHPLSLEFLQAGHVDLPDNRPMALADRKPGFERPASQHVLFPGGYRASLSFEQQPPGLCSHLSISVTDRDKPGMAPSPEAVALICEEFGVPFPADKTWVEEFDPGEYAVNLLSVCDH